jgi:two-component system LytT family response regulator
VIRSIRPGGRHFVGQGENGSAAPKGQFVCVAVATVKGPRGGSAMETLRAILVDDERLARSSLRALLAEHLEVGIVAEAANAEEARELIEAEHPDVVFLDIQMPGGGGFELLQRLHDPPAIVFVTAYDEYAIRAFEVNAVDYLLKPVAPERLAMAVARLRGPDRRASAPVGPYSPDDQVLIKTRQRCFFLPVTRIVAIRAADNYSYVICEHGEEHLVRRSLKEWETILPTDSFVVLDRSVLINWRRVDKWVQRGRKIELYVHHLAAPLTLGRVAARRFKKAVVPKIDGGS